MVRSLHASGLEVFLDVVYNHTGEANRLGPTLSFRASTIRRTTISTPTIVATTGT